MSAEKQNVEVPQRLLEVFQPRTYVNRDGNALPYRLLIPLDYSAAKKCPLVLFLHGAGERGSDNAAQLLHGVYVFAQPEVMEKHPAVVVAPQCPEGARWCEVDWNEAEHHMPGQVSEPLRLALELVNVLGKEFSIDSARLYITGLSMGGFGTWDAISRHPEKFAAAVPICGGGDVRCADRLTKLPIWAFHGGADAVVSVTLSRNMVKAIERAGGHPRYTEYPSVGHNSWKATYENPEMFDWLFAQRREAR